MDALGEAQLAEIVENIRRSPKYREIPAETVSSVVASESGRYRKPAQVMAAARERLHKVVAFYLGEPDYRVAPLRLQHAFATGDDVDIRSALVRILESHASTRERLPILSVLYPALWERIGTPARLIDLACALNPLSFRWMGLPSSVNYEAWDINPRFLNLIDLYFCLEGLPPPGRYGDVLTSPPQGSADVALLFKMFHCLEQRCRGAGLHVVAKVRAHHVVVSFPTRNLAGRRADICANYEPSIVSEVRRCGWSLERLDVGAEAFLILQKPMGTF